MELHFVAAANDFVFYQCLKKARCALSRCVLGNVAGRSLAYSLCH